MADKPNRAGWWKYLLLLAILCVAAGGAYWWWNRHAEPQPDMTAVVQGNVRGIGFMDKFEYDNAVKEFEKVVAKAPRWLPGRINLAIALLNACKGDKDCDARPIKIYRDILKEDTDNPYAHFGLGVLLKDFDREQARKHFEAVTRIDPNDADAWYELAATRDAADPECMKDLERALALEPNLSGAIYKYGEMLNRKSPGAGKEFWDKHAELKKLGWLKLTEKVYTGLGKYTICIGTPQGDRPPRPFGPLPLFEKSKEWQVELAPGARWAKAEDFGPGAIGDLYRAVRKRFGMTMIALDYDRDGKPDLFLAGAVVENGKVRDLILHNEGGKFRDVTAEMGLADHPASFGAFVADYDNDDFPDLLLTGPAGVRLFRNPGIGKARAFADVTKEASLASITAVCLGAAWVDLDQDGDLDLLICQYAANPEEALSALAGKSETPGPGLAIFLNVGEAKPTKQEYFGLTSKFRRIVEPEALIGKAASAVNLTITDVDADRDVDMVALADRLSPTAILNDRLLKFHREPFPDSLLPAAPWNGMLILDSRQRDLSDWLAIGPGQTPRLLLNSAALPKEPFDKRFSKGAIDSPNLIQAKAIDIDLDGNMDVIGLSESREPVLLHNDTEKLRSARDALGVNWPKDIQAVTAIDIDGDDFPEVLVWSESAGLEVLRNRGNGNHGLRLEVRGRRFQFGEKLQLRCNNDGVGVKIRAYSGGFETGIEMGTLAAGLGQSHENLVLGLGKNAVADLVRLRWPDGTWQGETSLAAGQLHKIFQVNRMPDSCPLLFTWNGERYVFISDFLGGGALGEPNPDGSFRQPRPEESVWIDGTNLKPKGGKLHLKIGEPMDEATYLDRLQLIAVDHPKDLTVYPEERFAAVISSQDLHFLGEKIFPRSATDHKGRDVTEALREWDRRYVDGFATRSWLGFAEEHWVELDFGDRLAGLRPGERLFLCLAGWTDYPYPEAIMAAAQAGVPLVDPVLERRNADGTWEKIVDEVGFPAGRPRMMLVEIAGKVGGPACVLRLRTNMQIYWDQIFIAPAIESLSGKAVAETGSILGKQIRTTTLPVHQADLRPGGYMQEYSPDGKPPTIYDFQKHEPAPVSRLKGMMTRFGDVTELLHDQDDRFVIFGAGDVLSVTFDASKLPDLPNGWTRCYVLRSWGYCKSASIHTATCETIEPLPFRRMSAFPYPPSEAYPQTPAHQEYLRNYQTRKVGN